MNLIEEILKIEQIQKERKIKNKLLSYNSGEKKHLKQIEFHKCKKKNRWVFGGNRSGKTECGAVEVIYFARGCHPYREIKGATNGWVVSLSTQVQRDVAQSKILNYLNPDWIEDVVMLSGRKDNYKNGVIDYILIKNVFGTTSKIGFKSCDQGREKFQGTSLDYVWFDEEPPYDIYSECRMRVLDKNGDIFATMTPLKGMTFVYDEIFLNKFDDKNIWHQFMQWDDNPYISEEAKQAIQTENAGTNSVDMVEENVINQEIIKKEETVIPIDAQDEIADNNNEIDFKNLVEKITNDISSETEKFKEFAEIIEKFLKNNEKTEEKLENSINFSNNIEITEEKMKLKNKKTLQKKIKLKQNILNNR